MAGLSPGIYQDSSAAVKEKTIPTEIKNQRITSAEVEGCKSASLAARTASVLVVSRAVSTANESALKQ
jgi:hypothetical protein